MRVDSKLCRETVEKIAMGLDVIDKKHTEVLELMKNDDTGKHFQEDVKHLETLQLYYDEVVENNPRKSHGPNDYLRKKKEDSLVINYLLRRMKYYILKMELLAKHQNYEVIEATERTTNLLNMLLPAFISRRLQEGQLPKPELFPEATVCFSSIQNFNEIYTALRPKEVVRFLNELYNKMDKIIEKHQVFKVDSINEMFLMASGLPIRNGSEHVKEIGKLTLDLREVIGKCVLRIVNQKFAFMENKSVALGKVTNIRISFGVNTGEVVGGVVGAVLPRYTILGDTVNTSSRMLKYSSPNRILVTESTRILLNSFPTRKFLLIPREKFIVKGKGLMQTHWLEELGKTEKQLSEEYREDYERYLKFNDAQPTRDHGSSFGMRHSLRSLDADSKSKHQLEVMNMTKLNNTIKSNCQQKNKMLDAPIHTVVCPYGSNDIDRFTLFQLDYSLIAQDTLSYFDEKCSPQFNQKKISEILPDSRLGKHEQVDAAVCVKSYHDEDDTLKLQSLLPTTVPEAIAQKHFKRDALEKIVKFLWKTDVSETAETFANLFSRDRRKGKNEAENNDILTQIMNLNNSNLAGHRNVSSHSSSRSSKQASGLNRPRSATSQVIRNLKSAHTYGVTKPSKHYYTREALYLFYARLAYFYSYVQNDMIGFNE
ncbi:hypothetical protein SNEBB_006349 [Seison nebaliae]|nr:hypothetical protein SNEBB_006349 [Seison nebaliae]